MNLKRSSCAVVKLFLGMAVVQLLGCSAKPSNEDLLVFIEEVKAQPKMQIEPLPPFRPYKAFTYSATALRGPFDVPVKVQNLPIKKEASSVKPDFNRPKEFLEEFAFGSLSMVGTISQNSELWVLINAGAGGIFRVKEGNYLGKNHGKIVNATENQIDVVEIVPNGTDGWIQRPRTIKLQGN